MERLTNPKPPNCALCLSSFFANVKSPSAYKKPLVLHCGHSACDKCLSSELGSKNDVECNICHFVSSVPSSFTMNDLEQYFPVNYFLLGLWTTNSSAAKANALDALIKFSKPRGNKRERIKAIMCNECMDSHAECHCKQCGAPYCNLCFKMVHIAARALRNHVKVPLLESCLNIEVGQPLMCSNHAETKFEFYCTLCKVPTCPRCMVEKHQGHGIDLLENQKENCLDEFLDRYVKVANVLQRLKSSHKSVEGLIQENNSPKAITNKIHGEIFYAFIHLHGKLTTFQNNMHLKLESADEFCQLEELLSSLKESINTTEALLVSTKVLLQDISLQKTNTYMAVIDNLKKKEELPCFLIEGEISSSPKFTLNEDILKDLDRICDLELPASHKYKLVTEANLPTGYEIQPVKELSRDEVLNMINNSSVSSGVSSNHSDSFSDRVMIGQRTSRSTSPSSSCSDRLSHASFKSNVANEAYKYPNELSIGCQVRVTLSHLVSPSDFYVQRECAVRKIADFTLSLKPSVLKNQKPPQKLSKGLIYLVLYNKDNKWYRARIIEVMGEDLYRVHYIDFGNSEIVPHSRIRTLPKNVFNIPVLAMRCKLHNCVPRDNEWDPEAVALMAKVIDNDYVSMIVKDKTPSAYIVDLYKLADNYLLNIQQSLCYFEFASMAAESEWNHLPALQFMPSEMQLPKQKFNHGDIFEVYVSYVESPHEFYVQNYLSSKRLLRMSDELNKAYNSQNESRYVYHPQKKMYIAARYSKDSKWYRGRITDCLRGKTVKVFFIDFGAEEVVAWENIRFLQTRFSKLAPQAINCLLSDVLPPNDHDDWSPDICADFQNLVFKQRLKVVVHHINEDNRLTVIAYKSLTEVDICINAVLVSKGQAISTGKNSTVAEHPKVISKHTKEPAVAVQKSKAVQRPIPELPIPAIPDENQLLSSTATGPDGSLRIHVLVKRLVNPSEFYVSFSHFKELLDRLESDMQNHYNTVTYEEKEWEADAVCALNYDGKWYRGLVLQKLPENQLKVNLVDEGSEVVIESNKVCQLLEKFLTMQDGVLRCHLGGLQPCLPDGWSSSSVNEFGEFVTNYKEILYITKMGELKNSSMPVELFARIGKPAGPTEPISFEWKSFNNYLRFIGLAKADGMVEWDFDGNILNRCALEKTLDQSSGLEEMLSNSLKITGDGSNLVTSIEPSEATEETLREPDHLNMISIPDAWIPAKPLENLVFIACPTYVDADCNIYFHDFHASSDLLEEISQALCTKYDGSLPKPCDSTLHTGDICVSQYHVDKKWYRGVILKVTLEFDEYEVQYVDYGNVELCKLMELRKIPVCHHIPIQTSRGVFHNIEPAHPSGKWTKEDIETIQYNIVDFHCHVELVSVPGKPNDYVIKKLIRPDGINLISWLVKNDRAKYVKKAILQNGIKEGDEIDNEEQENHSTDEDVKKTTGKTSPKKQLKEENRLEKERSEDDVQEGLTKEELANGTKDNNDKPPELPEMDWFTMVELEKGAISNEKELKSSDESRKGSAENSLKLLDSNSDEGSDQDDGLDIAGSLLAHWSTKQHLSPQQEAFKYKELTIPSSVYMLLVEASAFHTPTLMVAHLCDVEEDPELLEKIAQFKELSAKIQDDAPSQPVLTAPFKYKACCAQFSQDQQWYRGFVLDYTANGDIIIQFVDFGNVEIQSPLNVKELKEEWTDLEVFGILCELNNIRIPKEVNHPEIIKDLTDVLESKGLIRAIIKDRTPRLKVDLYKGDNLAYEELLEKGLFLHS